MFKAMDRVRVVTDNGKEEETSIHFFDRGTLGTVNEVLRDGYVVTGDNGMTQLVDEKDIVAV